MLHERWKRDFGGEGVRDGKFTPFNSKMDWRLAEWAIKSVVGHKQLDYLLSIPGVSVLVLVSPGYYCDLCKFVEKAGLLYSNTRSLHQFIGDIPECEKWWSFSLSFKDSCEDKYIIHYRSPLKAIKALLSDLALV